MNLIPRRTDLPRLEVRMESIRRTHEPDLLMISCIHLPSNGIQAPKHT